MVEVSPAHSLPCSDHKLYPRFTLFLVGYSWMLFTPMPLLGSRTYIDENALQPGQVCGAQQARLLQRSFISLLFRSTLTGTGETCIAQTCIFTNWISFETQMLIVSSEILSCFLPFPAMLIHEPRRAHFFMTEFSKLGIAASTQSYTFTSQNGVCFSVLSFVPIIE